MTVNDSMDIDHVDSTHPEEVAAAPTRLRAHSGPLSGMLLGRTPGLTRELIIRGVTSAATYSTGTEAMYAAYEVLEHVFGDWEEGA